MFRIIRKDRLDDLKRAYELWKENYHESDRARLNLVEENYRLRRKLADLNKRKIVNKEDNMAYNFTNFSLSANEGNLFEVVRASDGCFLDCEGFETYEAAVDAAKEVAKAFPTEKFYVYGVQATVEAQIPVAVTTENTRTVDDK